LLKQAIDARASQATAAIDVERADLGKRAMDQIARCAPKSAAGSTQA